MHFLARHQRWQHLSDESEWRPLPIQDYQARKARLPQATVRPSSVKSTRAQCPAPLGGCADSGCLVRAPQLFFILECMRLTACGRRLPRDVKNESSLLYTRQRDIHAVGIVLLQMLLGLDVMQQYSDVHMALDSCG